MAGWGVERKMSVVTCKSALMIRLMTMSWVIVDNNEKGMAIHGTSSLLNQMSLRSLLNIQVSIGL